MTKVSINPEGAFGKALLLVAALSLSMTAAAQQLPDFTGLVEDTSPAVVNITTSSYGNSDSELSDEELPEFFRRFFEAPENRGNPRSDARPSQPRRSGGSGFIIDESGYIITNHHVIEGAEEILVQMADNREFDAELIGSDSASDIALLKIKTDEQLPYLRVGSAENLKLGEWVIAIGSPFGFEQSVTAGIVSAKGRFNGSQQYVPFIQTDVPINRGNSGGPLLNMNGEVVGVNSWILSSNGGYIGLSFSIPIEVASNTVSQLRSHGRVSRGLLGVGIERVDRDMARYLNLDRPTGALVNRIVEGQAADKAGLQVGDVILEFDGTEIAESAALPPIVGATPPGERVPVLVNRDGKKRVFQVVVAELEPAEAIQASLGEEPSGLSNVLGLRVESIAAEERGLLGDPEGGVLVTEVESESAWRAGIREGDVILRVNREKIDSLDGFEDAVDDVEAGDTVALLLFQNGNPNFVAYTPEDEDASRG